MGSINISFFNKAICYAIIVFVGFCGTVRADSWQDDLYINGFFTLDLTTSDNDIPLVGADGEPRLYEKDKVNAENTLVGGQIEYAFTEQLSLFVQGSASFDGVGSLNTEIDWAYVSYDFGADWVARAGKFQTPFLQGIELRNIGFSRNWARALTPSSGASGFNHFLGAELLKHVSVGEHNFDFQLSLGEAEHGLDQVQNKDMKLASVKYQRDQFWLRTAIMQADYSVFTPSKLLITDSGSVVMASVEAELTVNQFILNMGYSDSSSDVTPDDKMSYISLAYNIGEFVPYVFVVKRNQFFVPFNVPTADSNSDSPPPLPPPPSGLRGPNGDVDLNSVAAGVRWNFATSLALKLQVEKVDLTDDARNPATVKQDSNILSVVLEGAF